MTLTLYRVAVTRVRISGRGLLTYQVRWKSEKNFLWMDRETDRRAHVHTYGWTNVTSNIRSIRTLPRNDLKIGCVLVICSLLMLVYA